jgi:AraC-like DNA-binding protein
MDFPPGFGGKETVAKNGRKSGNSPRPPASCTFATPELYIRVVSSVAAYAEWGPPADLAWQVDRLWVRHASGAVPMVPRPAVDLLMLPNGECWLAGPETRARRGALPPGGSLVGARLRPGAVAAVFGVAADEVLVAGAPVSDLLGDAVARRVADELAVSGSRAAAVFRVLRLLSDRRPHTPDRQLQRVLDAMHAAPGAPVGRHAALASLSERQLRRRFGVAVGLRPKSYVRVVRLHHALAAAHRVVRPDWAEIAQRTGFYDQSHLLAEFRDAVGVTPRTLLTSDDVRFLQAGPNAR